MTKVLKHPSRTHPRTAVFMLNDGHLYEKTENDILTVGELEDYRVNSSVVLCGGQANKVTIARDIVGLDFEHFKRIR